MKILPSDTLLSGIPIELKIDLLKPTGNFYVPQGLTFKNSTL
jgi:hypothetical protein